MNLPVSFQRYGTAVFAESPALVHSWSIEPHVCTLSIPTSSSCGFNTECIVEQDTITLYWGNWHTRFELEADADEFVEDTFGLIRDMLSPDMRIRELCANTRPYRGFLEAFDGTKWKTEDEMGLIFWNYFAKRSVKTYANSTLPSRMSTTD